MPVAPLRANVDELMVVASMHSLKVTVIAVTVLSIDTLVSSITGLVETTKGSVVSTTNDILAVIVSP